MNAIFLIAAKEWVDAFRDRRSLYTLLIGALFGPLMIGFMFNQIARQQKAAQEIQIPVTGPENAPVLVSWLAQQSGVEILPGPENPEEAVRERRAEFVLVIGKEFAAKFRDSRPAPVQVVSDATSQSTRSKVSRLNHLLAAFSSETGGLRLMARGVSPGIVATLKIEQVEVATAQQRAAMIFNFIPMFLVLALFTAGMPIASDSTAGERERGSLEPLLLNPIPRWQFVAGKWLAASAAAMLGMALTLSVTMAVLFRLPLEELGVRNAVSLAQVLLLLAAVAPMGLIAPAVQMFVSCFARTFKEAQSYLGLLMILPTIPGIVIVFYPLTNRPWLHPLPILGQYAMVSEILGGKDLPALSLLGALAVAASLTGLLLALATRLFSSEKIIFGR
ncbi:MAG TPA: ABC transporter permease subunit [Bryobacteraceae bacterium]|nr:ABC transporter permease subunit [Bryobacteraceae bacterium]